MSRGGRRRRGNRGRWRCVDRDGRGHGGTATAGRDWGRRGDPTTGTGKHRPVRVAGRDHRGGPRPVDRPVPTRSAFPGHPASRCRLQLSARGRWAAQSGGSGDCDICRPAGGAVALIVVGRDRGARCSSRGGHGNVGNYDHGSLTGTANPRRRVGANEKGREGLARRAVVSLRARPRRADPAG